MGDRERLALFNRLGDISGQNVLDLFSGSGALGLEALSRGATSVVFIDASPKLTSALKANLDLLNLSTKGQVSTQKVQTFLDSPTVPDHKYDLIFADPPYDHLQFSTLQNIADFLSPQGIFTLSHPSTTPAPDIAKLTPVSSKSYAGCQLTFYQLS